MAHLMLVRHRRERTEAGEFLGIATLALTAPAAYYTSTGDMSILAFFLWFLGVAYSGVSVFYVKMKLAYSSPRPRPSKREGRSLILALVFYQTITIGSIVLLSSLALLPLWTIMAFAPITVQVVAGTVKRGRPLNVRRLGFILVGQSTGFVILIAAAFSLAR
jgi:hypothetical protein